MNKYAKEKYGYPIKNNELPISKALIDELDFLEEEYFTYLDWNDPRNPSPWSETQKSDFLRRTTIALEKLKSELGSDFEIKNEVYESIS